MHQQLIGTFDVVVRRFREWRAKMGWYRATRKIVRLALQVFLTPVFAWSRGRRSFSFRGKQYRYFCHWYNTTFDNERAIEVPIVCDFLRALPAGSRALEIGNVLSHYTSIPHDILDKYEKGDGILHDDVVNFQPADPYDLIISISTLEHVGFDESPRDSQKFLRAVANLRMCLKIGGQLVVTIPVGYNPGIMPFLQDEKLFDEQYYLQRVSLDNRWEECSQAEAFARKFNEPYPFGNAITIGILRRSH